jgi:small subunit ribosomal protein S4
MRVDGVCRLCRAAGEKLFLKGERCFTPKCAMTRRPYKPGQHGEKRRGKVSNYGQQLIEKQKARRTYNLNERQMRRMYEIASKSRANTGEILLQMLESQLSNVLYQAGLADSRRHAGQIIGHGGVMVNGRKTTSPSMLVKAGTKITLKKAINANPEVAARKTDAPAWLKVDRKNMSIDVQALPRREDITTPLEEQLIIEYYSRLI